MRPLLLGVAAAGVAVALFANPAVAAVTIGTPLDGPPPDTGTAGGPRTFAQAAPSGGIALTSPYDGVIVRWRVRNNGAACCNATVALRVVHPGVGPATGAGTSAVVPLGAPGTATYDTRLPLLAGDRVGLNGSTNIVVERSGGSGVDFWEPPLVDGAPPRAPDFHFANEDVLFNADVEPDVDRDGYGDETQDSCPAKVTTQGACFASGVTIGGRTEVGETVVATGGSAQGGTPSYQWLRGNGSSYTPIPGATGTSYNAGRADRGKRLEVTATVADSRGSESVTSAPSAVVGPPRLSSTRKRVQRVLKQRGVVVTVKTDVPGTLIASGNVALRGAARSVRLRGVKRALPSGVRRSVKLKASRKALGQLKRALRRRHRLTANVSLVLKDSAGGQTRSRLSIRLKP
jgi:hypothetical protein